MVVNNCSVNQKEGGENTHAWREIKERRPKLHCVLLPCYIIGAVGKYNNWSAQSSSLYYSESNIVWHFWNGRMPRNPGMQGDDMYISHTHSAE